MSVNDEMFDLFRLVNISADVRVVRRTGLAVVTAAPPDGRVEKSYHGATLGEAVLQALRDMGDPRVPATPRANGSQHRHTETVKLMA